MRFHPSDEQRAIQESLRGTLADTLPPERLRALMDAPVDIDRPSWDALMALGLGGLALPEADGGSGLGLVDLAMAAEMLGAAAAAGPVVPHLLAGLALARSPNEEAAAVLPGLASGVIVATVALGGGWVPETWPVALEGGTLTGAVRFVQGACAAGLFVVGTQGGGLAMARAGAGIRAESMDSSDRTRPMGTLILNRAPAVELFAPGEAAVADWFDAGLVLTAADALGGAQSCLDLSVAYAKEREQFGRPIGGFQALKHQLATMALEVEPARALVWYAAYALDRRLPEARRMAALAKAHIADRYVSVTRAAIAAHGGIGYSWEYRLNIWFRRALADRAYLGGPALHRARAADLAGW